MTFKESVKTCLLTKYCSIRGRASRSEYWWFGLFMFLTMAVTALTFTVASSILFQPDPSLSIGALTLAAWLALIVPGICVGIRRLHDLAKPGWWILIPTAASFVAGLVDLDILSLPVTIWYIWLMCQPGTSKDIPNPYGESNCG